MGAPIAAPPLPSDDPAQSCTLACVGEEDGRVVL